MKQQLVDFYLDWVNNFLSISYMAEWYGITIGECTELVEIGKKYHEERVRLYKLLENKNN